MPNSLNKNSLFGQEAPYILLFDQFRVHQTLFSQTIAYNPSKSEDNSYAHSKMRGHSKEGNPSTIYIYAHVDVLRFTSTKPKQTYTPCSFPNSWHYFLSTANREARTPHRRHGGAARKNKANTLVETLYIVVRSRR